MKKLTVIAMSALLSLSAWAQGTVNFNNSNAAIGAGGAPVFDVDGTTALAGTGFVAQLYAGPDANSLAPIGATLTFRTGAGAGFLNTTGQDTARIIPTVAPGAQAVIQVRAWDASYASYEAAAAAGGKAGASANLTVTTGGAGQPPSLPANLVGLQSFSLSVVPEPGTLALVALGACALFLRRRKTA
jgi:hypothetical protein